MPKRYPSEPVPIQPVARMTPARNAGNTQDLTPALYSQVITP
jgi:hypothetical protein